MNEPSKTMLPKKDEKREILSKEESPEQDLGAEPQGIPIQSTLKPGESPIETQSKILSDPRFSTAQRQSLVTRIGQEGGSRYLQRVIASVQDRLYHKVGAMVQTQEQPGAPEETRGAGPTPVSIAKVTFVKGEAYIDNPAVIDGGKLTKILPSKYDLKEGDFIYEGSEVKTGKKSRLEIVLSDMSIVRLGSKSSILLAMGSGGGMDAKARLANYITKTEGSDKSFQITTSNAVAGVRG